MSEVFVCVWSVWPVHRIRLTLGRGLITKWMQAAEGSARYLAARTACKCMRLLLMCKLYSYGSIPASQMNGDQPKN